MRTRDRCHCAQRTRRHPACRPSFRSSLRADGAPAAEGRADGARGARGQRPSRWRVRAAAAEPTARVRPRAEPTARVRPRDEPTARTGRAAGGRAGGRADGTRGAFDRSTVAEPTAREGHAVDGARRARRTSEPTGRAGRAAVAEPTGRTGRGDHARWFGWFLPPLPRRAWRVMSLSLSFRRSTFRSAPAPNSETRRCALQLTARHVTETTNATMPHVTWPCARSRYESTSHV